MVWIVLDTDYPGPPPKMVFRGGTEKNCRDWIAKRRNREPDKVDRGAYVIEGRPEGDDGL
jgi:hypothetical protein